MSLISLKFYINHFYLFFSVDQFIHRTNGIMAENENNRIQMDFLEVCSFGDLKQAKAMLKSGKIDLRFRHHGNGWFVLVHNLKLRSNF